MSQSGFVNQIYKSRNNILAILKTRGYDVSDYENQSISQIHVMFQTDQLDMLLNNVNEQKVYVKYHLGKTLRQNNIMDFVDDLFTIDNVLKKEDELIVITRDIANETMEKVLSQLWSQHKYFVTVFGIKSLQFNILEHTQVPPHRVMTQLESEEIKKKYNITVNYQLPDISRYSPVAQAIGIRPGELCEITRPSKTAISVKFYRICSQ
jgi:DNA-directed RNA polymerase subunit H (RpoH/RPB5)